MYKLQYKRSKSSRWIDVPEEEQDTYLATLRLKEEYDNGHLVIFENKSDPIETYGFRLKLV